MKVRVVVLGFGLWLCGTSAYAQLPAFDVHLGLRGGYFMPLGIIAEDASDRETQLSTGIGFGASLEIDIPLSPINVRANAAATFGRSLEVEGQEVPDAEVDMLIFTGDLVFRPLPRLVVAQPYLLLGGGIKKYSSENAFDDSTDLTAHLGAGADMKLGVVSLLVEINDYISSFKPTEGDDSRLQNDVFVMVGFRIGVL